MDDKEDRSIFKQPIKKPKANSTSIAKIIIRSIFGIIFSFIALLSTTWIVALFKPENVKQAFEIVKNLF